MHISYRVLIDINGLVFKIVSFLQTKNVHVNIPSTVTKCKNIFLSYSVTCFIALRPAVVISLMTL